MTPRLSRTLLIAIAVHAATISGLLLVKPIEAHRAMPVEAVLEIESNFGAPSASASEAPSKPRSVATHGAVPRVVHAPTVPVPAPSTSNVDPIESTVAAVDAISDRAEGKAAPVNLGIGDYWKTIASTASATQTRAADSPERPEARIERSVRDALNARDVEHGLGGGGPIVTAAHEAASSENAPDAGSATFDIESDANGKVRSVNVTSVKEGDARRWGNVAHALLALLAPKQLRTVSPGGGLRVRLRVTVDRALPSGNKATTSLGAVADDAPGGNHDCVGTGLTRKCLKGLPIGITLNSVDISNAGATASRVVRAQILGEDHL